MSVKKSATVRKKSSFARDRLSRLALTTALCGVATSAIATPAVFFNDDTAAGLQTFRDTVAAADAAYNAANPGSTQTSTVFYIDITNSTGSSFSVTENGQTVYVKTTLAGNAAANNGNGDEGSDGFTNWSVSYTPGNFNSAITAGYTLSFYSDSGFTTPHMVNAAGLFTSNWGTCCTGSNTTPGDGSAMGSQIYMLFNGSTPLLVGGITSSIGGEEHFVAAIDDSNSFNSVTMVPNGSGEAFGAGGTLIFSTVQIGSVPAGSSVVTVGDGNKTDIIAPVPVTDLTNGTVNPVFDGGTLTAPSDTTVPTDVTINNTGGTIDTSGYNATFSGDLTDTSGQSGGLTKTGAGTLTLAGDNSFSGGLNIAGGTLQAASDGNLGTGAITIDNATLAMTATATIDNSVNVTHSGSTLDVGGNDVTLSGAVGGTGALNKTGGGTLTLTGSNGFSGGLNITDGTVQAAGDANVGTGTITIANSTLAVTSSGTIDNGVDVTSANSTLGVGGNDVTLSGAVGGTGVLNKTGGGTLTLSGSNGFSGGLNITDGTVQAAGDANVGTGTITIANSTLAVTSSGTIDNGVNVTSANSTVGVGGNSVTLSGAIGGAGALNKTGGGTLTLAGSNGFSGGLNITDGTVQAAGDANVGTGAITIASSTLAVTSSGTIDNGVTVTSANSTVGVGGNSVTLSGAIGGTGALNKTGGGTLTLSGSNGFSGGLNITDGVVEVGGDANVGTGTIIIASSTLAVSASGTIDNGIDLTRPSSTIDTYASAVTLSGGIGGAGALNKAGSGTLTLSGANGFSGGLMINDGTVEVSDDQNVGTGTISIGNATLVLAGSGTIDNGVLLTTERSTVSAVGNVTLSGAIDGTGALNKTGGGTLTLTGANSFSGGLLVNSGTVAAAGDANIGTGTITIDNAILAITADGTIDNAVNLTHRNAAIGTDANAVTLSGTVSGTGALNKSGAGTLTLAGNNDFAGGLVVGGGTVRAAGAANLGSGVITIDNATLAVTAEGTIANTVDLTHANATLGIGDNAVTLSGPVGGAGALNKTGAGKLTLTAANGFSGGLAITEGMVEAASGASLGTGQITIGNATLALTADGTIAGGLTVTGEQSTFDTGGNAVTVSGPTSGGGVLNKTGSGTLTLSGANGHASTFVRGGTLVASSSGALGSIDGDLSIGAASRFVTGQDMTISQRLHITGRDAVFDTGAANVVLAGGADGTDCLNKRGSGRLTLTAAASNAIGACVFEGTLSFNNRFDGHVWVFGGGVGSGAGTVAGDMDVFGTLAPGNSPGVLTVNGSVTQHQGSTLSVDIDGATPGNGAGFHDQLILKGANSVYTAAGTITPVIRGITGDATNTFIPPIGSTYTVVVAEGGVKGTFDNIVQPASGMEANVRFETIYRPDAIILYITPGQYSGIFDAGTMGNASAVAGLADRFRRAPGSASDALMRELYPLNQAGLANLMEQLSGEVGASAMDSVVQATRSAQASVTDRLSAPIDAETPLSRRIWGTAGYDVNRIRADENGRGYRAGITTLIVGADKAFGSNIVAGLAFAYGRSNVSTPNAGSARARTYQGVLYGRYEGSNLYANAMLSVGSDSYRLNRTVALAAGAASLQGKGDGSTVAGDVEAGYRLRFGAATVTPAIGLSYAGLNRDGFGEGGNTVVALGFDKDYRRSAIGRLGARLAASYAVGGVDFMPYASAFVTHEMKDLSSTITPTLLGERFVVRASNPGRTAARLNAGMNVAVSPAVTMNVNYRYGDAGNLRSNAVSGGISIRW